MCYLDKMLIEYCSGNLFGCGVDSIRNYEAQTSDVCETSDVLLKSKTFRRAKKPSEGRRFESPSDSFLTCRKVVKYKVIGCLVKRR